MESLIKIDNRIRAAVEKKKEIVAQALDGRSQRWLSEKTGIEETRISRWLNGNLVLDEKETEIIDSVLSALI